MPPFVRNLGMPSTLAGACAHRQSFPGCLWTGVCPGGLSGTSLTRGSPLRDEPYDVERVLPPPLRQPLAGLTPASASVKPPDEPTVARRR